MEKIILGILMMKQQTIYELQKLIEINFSSMCSSSMGSIQAALKKLLGQNMIVYEESAEKNINKKMYSLTDQGTACFLEWVRTSMVAGKTKEMELSKLFFMGFVPAPQRQALIEAYLIDLRKEKAKLEEIKRQDIDLKKLHYLISQGENEKQLARFGQAAGYQSIQEGMEGIVRFELSALQFGIDRMDFEIAWFEKLKADLTEA